MNTPITARRLAGCVLVAVSVVSVATADPVAVQQKLLDALSRGDVEAALALYADDSVIDVQSGLCSAAPCVGKAAIRKDLERYVADKTRRVTVLSTYVSGDVILTRFEASSAIMHAAGVDRIILWSIREIRGDKIASTRCCLPDRTDAQTARFVNWDEAHPVK